MKPQKIMSLLSLILAGCSCICDDGKSCEDHDGDDCFTTQKKQGIVVATTLPGWINTSTSSNAAACECDYGGYWGNEAPWERVGPGPFYSPYKCFAPGRAQVSCETTEWCGQPAIVPVYSWSPDGDGPVSSRVVNTEKFEGGDGHIYCLLIREHTFRR
jgi:hypothetical protein